MAVLLPTKELVEGCHGRCALQQVRMDPMGEGHVGHLWGGSLLPGEAEENLHKTQLSASELPRGHGRSRSKQAMMHKLGGWSAVCRGRVIF